MKAANFKQKTLSHFKCDEVESFGSSFLAKIQSRSGKIFFLELSDFGAKLLNETQEKALYVYTAKDPSYGDLVTVLEDYLEKS